MEAEDAPLCLRIPAEKAVGTGTELPPHQRILTHIQERRKAPVGIPPCQILHMRQQDAILILLFWRHQMITPLFSSSAARSSPMKPTL